MNSRLSARMQTIRRALTAAVLLILVQMAPARAQEQVTLLRGSWSATVGTTATLQGTWSAQLQLSSPDAATGTWTLVGAGNKILARGTWSATRTAGTWRGAWSARGAARGAARTGTWQADAAGGAKTLADLLRSSLEAQLNGVWHSAGRQGRWSLKA